MCLCSLCRDIPTEQKEVIHSLLTQNNVPVTVSAAMCVCVCVCDGLFILQEADKIIKHLPLLYLPKSAVSVCVGMDKLFQLIYSFTDLQ